MRTRSLLLPVEYRWSNDPAVDKSHPDYSDDQYLKDFDPKHRPAKEGMTPAVFRVKPLARKVMQRVLRLDKSDQLFECAIYSLVGVSGWEHNGVPVVLDASHMQEADGVTRLKESWVDLHFDAALFMELGGAAFAASGLRPLS